MGQGNIWTLHGMAYMKSLHHWGQHPHKLLSMTVAWITFKEDPEKNPGDLCMCNFVIQVLIIEAQRAQFTVPAF